MKPTINEQDTKVQAMLEAYEVEYKCHFVGSVEDEDWPCFKWSVSFYKNGHGFVEDFRMGKGHKFVLKTSLIRNEYVQHVKKHTDKPLVSIGRVEQGGVFGREEYTYAPTAAAVLYCLLSDAQSGSDMSFIAFCDELGYNTDSRKDLQTYMDCQKTAENLSNVFTSQQLEELREALQDY